MTLTTRDDETKSDPRGRPASPSKRKRVVFRSIAAGVPSLLGAAILVWLLIQQERLVIDPATGRIKLQWPPIYLEEPGHEVTGHRYIYDSELGWRNIPNWRWTTNGRTLTINSHGLRDSETDFAKPAGVKRILVLGDSYAWGYGVADDEVFAAVLESRLAESGRWEVVNAGVSGWGTDQELLFLKSEGLRYEPDIVVLALFLVNDPTNNQFSKQYGLYKPVFTDTDLRLANVPVPKPYADEPTIRSSADPAELTVAIIAQMAEVCRAHRCPLVIMKFGAFLNPRDFDVRVADSYVGPRLARLNDAVYFDLDRQFATRSITRNQLLVGNDDGHWNAFGHRRVAELLQEFLTDRGLLDGSKRMSF